MINKPNSTKNLDQLRQDINEIDDEIHSLLIRRSSIAVEVGKVKRRSKQLKSFIRPAREAEVMRRLLSNHNGFYPKGLIVSIWRQIISSTLSLESEFTISVFSGDDTRSGAAYENLARRYFGEDSPLRHTKTESGVLRAVRDGKSSVGILPIPEDERFDNSDIPWWATLASSGEFRPRVIARIPWLMDKHGVSKGLEGLAIACSEPEDSGDDMTFLVMKFKSPVSADKITKSMGIAGLSTAGVIASNSKINQGEPDWKLIEVKGFISEEDSRLAKFSSYIGDALEIYFVLGSYARPDRN